MLRYLTLITLLLGFTTNARASIDCEHLPGRWHGERYEESQDAHRTTIATFYADGRYRFEFHTYGEDLENFNVDTGIWVCRDDQLVLRDIGENGLFHIYKILELAEEVFVFELIQADCSQYVGDCEGVVYGLVKESTSIE